MKIVKITEEVIYEKDGETPLWITIEGDTARIRHEGREESVFVGNGIVFYKNGMDGYSRLYEGGINVVTNK